MAMSVVTASRAWCGKCAWTWDGPDSDFEARRHTGEPGLKHDGPPHPTATQNSPVQP